MAAVNGDSGGRNSLFEGPFGRLLLPGIILQSVLIGGGYATGREIVQYGAKFGALGWIAGLGIFIGFGLMAFLMFEIARRFQAFDYRSLLQQLIGPLYWLYDVVYVLFAILIIAVMAAATGAILQNTLGLNYWVGVVLTVALVGLLNFFGEGLIERFKSLGTLLLYLGYILFAAVIIASRGDQIVATLASGNHSLTPDASIAAVVWSGLLYVGYNLVVYPSALFTVRRQTRLRHTVIAGIVAGILMVVPWFLTYFALMGYYPSQEVFGAPIPWLQMLEGQPAWIIVVFGIVVGWTLIETATGIIYALIARIDHSLAEAGRPPMSRQMSGGLAVVILVLALILAQVGIIALVAKGYTAMAYAMMLLFGLPLLLRGGYLILAGRGLDFSPASDPTAHDRQQ